MRWTGLLLGIGGAHAFSTLPPDDLKVSFAYFKEERECFTVDQASAFFSSPSLTHSDVVVLLQLAHNPDPHSRTFWHARGIEFEDEGEGCPSPSLHTHLHTLLSQAGAAAAGGAISVRQLTYEDFDEPEEAVLHVYYDPAKLKPVAQLSQKNRFEDWAAHTSDDEPVFAGDTDCIESEGTLVADGVAASCPSSWSEAKMDGYKGSKAMVGASFQVMGTDETIAFIGVNLPSKYWKGKNHMVERYMQSMGVLKADHSVIVGDLNTRLELDMFDMCPLDCVGVPNRPEDVKRWSELYKELNDLPEDAEACGILEDSKICTLEDPWCAMEPVSENEDADVDLFGSTGVCGAGNKCEVCQAEAEAGLGCRRACFDAMLEDPNTLSAWDSMDTLQTQGRGYELLTKYFHFPSASSTTTGEPRMLTYKRVLDADWNELLEEGEAEGPNPCTKALTKDGPWSKCFMGGDNEILSKEDRIPPNDPVPDKRGEWLYHAPLGWLDGVGWSHSLSSKVLAFSYDQKDQFTQGDHAPFLAYAEMHV